METTTRVQIAQAELIALGYVEQTANGIRLTDKGYERANQVWQGIEDTSKMLLVPFLRKQLRLAFWKSTDC